MPGKKVVPVAEAVSAGEATYKTDAIPEAEPVQKQGSVRRSGSLKKSHSLKKMPTQVQMGLGGPPLAHVAYPVQGYPVQMITTACVNCNRVSQTALQNGGYVSYTCPYCNFVNQGPPRQPDGGSTAAGLCAGTTCCICCFPIPDF